MLKLSSLDRAIVAHYPLRCHEPIATVAKSIGASEHRVRYAVSRLREAGVLIPSTVVNISALGLARFTVFLSVSFGKHSGRQRLERAIGADPSTAFAARLAGDFDYELSLVSKDDLEARMTVARLVERSGGSIGRRIFLRRTRSVFMQRKYLSAKRAPEHRVVYEPTPRARVDGVDERLLELLVHGPETSQRDLARAVSLSLPAVNARLRSLRNAGVLGPPVLLVHFEKYGSLFYSLLIAAQRWTEETESRLRSFASGSPYGVHFVTSTGEWDFEVGVEVESHDRLRAVQDSLEASFGDEIHQVCAIPRVSTLKFAPFPGRLFRPTSPAHSE